MRRYRPRLRIASPSEQQQQRAVVNHYHVDSPQQHDPRSLMLVAAYIVHRLQRSVSRQHQRSRGDTGGSATLRIALCSATCRGDRLDDHRTTTAADT